MITSIFAILMVASSWYSWRRNPMYSRRRTLHWMLAIGLSIAAAVGLFIAVIQLTQRQSQAVQFTAIFSAIFVATIALIAIIVRVSTPKTAALPANTRLLTLHRRRLIPWLKAAGETLLVLAVFALVPYVLPGKVTEIVQFVALFLAAWVVGLGGILLAAGYIGGLTLDRALTAVEANAWIHWSYSTEEWMAWVQSQGARYPVPARESKKRQAIGVAAIAVPFTVGAYFAGGTSKTVLLLSFAGSALFAIGLIVLLQNSAQKGPARFRRKLAQAPRETYLGPDGLFANGTYNPWLTTGVFLVEASAPAHDSGQESLLFRFEKVNPGSASTTVEQPVLIPSAADRSQLAPLLDQLQRELNTVATTARVRLA